MGVCRGRKLSLSPAVRSKRLFYGCFCSTTVCLRFAKVVKMKVKIRGLQMILVSVWGRRRGRVGSPFWRAGVGLGMGLGLGGLGGLGFGVWVLGEGLGFG